MGVLAKTRHYGAHYAKSVQYWCGLCEACLETTEISGAYNPAVLARFLR